MEQTLRALVLRRSDFGESDRRLVLLTRERGKFDAIAKGARKSGSRLAAATEPLSFVQVQVAEGKRIAYVTQAQPQASFRRIRSDYDRLVLALAYLELVAIHATHELTNEELFDSTFEALNHLEHHPKPLVALVWAELRLLEIEGVLPVFESCTVTGQKLAETPAWISPTAGGYVHSSRANDYADRRQFDARVLVGLSRVSELEAPPPKLNFEQDCLRALHFFWQHHIQSPLPAHESLFQVLSTETTSG